MEDQDSGNRITPHFIAMGTLVVTFKSMGEPKGLSGGIGDPTPTSLPPNVQPGPGEPQSESWRYDYEAIRDSLQCVRLPNKFCINDSQAGIASKDHEQAAILSKCGKFGETSV